MKRIVLLTVGVLLVMFSVNAQTIVTIGQHEMTANYPFYAPLENGRTQILYTAEEIGMNCDIEGLALNLSDVSGFVFENMTIRLGHYSGNVLDSVVTRDLQVVYQHTFTPKAAGWQMFLFDDYFTYNGKDALVVDICYSNHSSSLVTESTTVSAMGIPSRCLFSVSSDENGCELTDLVSSYFRPNIQLSVVGPNDCGKCHPSIVRNLGNTVDIVWKKNEVATQWKVAYNQTPLANPDSAQYSMVVSEPKCTLSNLRELSHYYVYVKSYCTNGDTSSWVMLEFNTVSQMAALPFMCDFESEEQNAGWKYYSKYVNNKNAWTIGSAAAKAGQKSLYISDLNGLVNHYSSQITKVIAYYDLVFEKGGYYQLSFDWKAQGIVNQDELKVYIADTQGDVETALLSASLLFSQPFRSSEWQHFTINFDASQWEGTNRRLMLQWTNSGLGNAVQAPASIDNICIEATSCAENSCQAVSKVTVSQLTSNAVQLSWGKAGCNANYTVYYGTDTTHLKQFRCATADTLVTIEPLKENTKYYFCVENQCGKNVYRSQMDSITTPMSTPLCDSSSRCTYKVMLADSQNGAVWRARNASIIVKMDQVQIARLTLQEGRACDTLSVLTCPDSPVEFIWSCGDGNVGQGSFAIIDPSGKEVVRYVSLPKDSGIVILTQRSQCNCCTQPADFMVSNITHHSAEFTWKASNVSQFEVMCLPYQDTPEHGVPVKVFQSSYKVENLISQSSYRFFVRSLCDSMHSDWVDGGTFVTAAIPAVEPCAIDFEEESENARWILVNNDTLTNDWCIDTLMYSRGSHSLYITNSRIQKVNQSNNKVSSVTWAYRDITFSNDEAHVISFDWKGKGLSGKTFANVYIGEMTDVKPAQNAGYEILAKGLTPLKTNLCNQSMWVHSIIPLDGKQYAGQTKRLYFMWCNTANNGTEPPVAIDNITIKPCKTPENLVVTHITGKTAAVSWSGVTSEYQLELVRVSDDSMSTFKVTDTTFLLQNLTLYADYKCRVRAVCGSYLSPYTDYVAFSACPSFDGTERIWYVSKNTGSDDNLGYTRSKPAKELGAVLGSPCIQDGDVIMVAEGVYKPQQFINKDVARSKTFLINKNITVKGGYNIYFSVQDPEKYATILDGDLGIENVQSDNAYHVLYFQPSVTKALVEGVTIQNGNADGSETMYKNGGGVYGGTVKKSRIVNNLSSAYGAGTYQTDLDSCHVENNTAIGNGGGAYQGNIYHSIIKNNSTNSFGGGVYQGAVYQSIIDSNRAYFGAGCYQTTLYNTLVKQNVANGNGGGKYGGNSYSCTFVNNRANNGGGQYNGAAYNSIYWGNSSQVKNVTLNYCAVQDQSFAASSSNINVSANNDGKDKGVKYVRFVNPDEGDYHLTYESVCVNAGDSKYMTVSDVDLDGHARLFGEQIDMGAYEFFVNTNCLPVDRLQIVAVESNQVTVTWQADSNYLKYKVAIKEKDSDEDLLSAEITDNVYTFKNLTLYKEYEWKVMGYCSEDSSLSVSGPEFKVCPGFDTMNRRIWYVSQEIGSNDNFGSKLSLPAKELSQVLSCQCLQDGDTILVAKGIYHPTQTIAGIQGDRNKTFFIDKNITIIGGYNSSFTQCDTSLYATVLDGKLGNSDTDRVYHVVICDKNSASKALLSRLTICGGYASDTVNTMYNDVVYDGQSGAGIMYGNISHCSVQHNVAVLQGGGMWGGSASNSVFSNNSGSYGGAVYGTVLHNCLVDHNSAVQGAGAYQSQMNNCTVVENKASHSFGGLYQGKAVNTVFWHNESVKDEEDYSGIFNYCALENYKAEGIGNIVLATENQGNNSQKNYVRFEDPSFNNYHLQYGSACINAGCNDSILSYLYKEDIAGSLRFHDSIVDMGAYEFNIETACEPVANLHLVNSDTLSATVAWDADTLHALYQLRLRKAGSENYHFEDTTSQNQYQFNGLEKYTGYEWSVRSICKTGDTSVYISGLAFKTCPQFDNPENRIWYVNARSGQISSLGTHKSAPSQALSRVLSCPCMESGDTVLVAEGTYFPSQMVTMDEAVITTFYVNRDITVIGGYDTLFKQYNPTAYPTVLDGNIGQKDNKTDNSAHVITAQNGTDVWFKGFTIQNGYNSNLQGAAAYHVNVEECILQNNEAQTGGGLAYGTAVGTLFKDNKANNGAGMAYAVAYRCIFENNQATQAGGGTYQSQLHSSLLYGNKAAAGGGSAYSIDYNNTYVFNSAEKGGGVASGISYNTILWGNYADSLSQAQCLADSKLHACAVQDFAGNDSTVLKLEADNFGADTTLNYVKFENPKQQLFNLQPGSACINHGDNDYVVNKKDLAGNHRTAENRVDMGAYETDFGAMSCKPASQLMVNNVTLTSAELSWKGTAPFYKLRYRSSKSGEENVVLLDKCQYTLNDLDVAVEYEWSILSCCDMFLDSSVYVSGPSFITCPRGANKKWYVSAAKGSDEKLGDSPTTAVKSISRLMGCSCVQDGDSVLMSQGTYLPEQVSDSNDLRTATFLLDRQIVLRGGYSDDFQLHNSDLYPTVLSGDLGVAGDDKDNAYHVVTALPSAPAVLQDLTITAGSADGVKAENQKGSAALFASLKHCVVTGNKAVRGAVYCSNASHTIFNNNESTYGGAAYVDSVVISNCLFYANKAQQGGAVYMEGNNRLINNTIVDNIASERGGALYDLDRSSLIVNTIIWHNGSHSIAPIDSVSSDYYHCAADNVWLKDSINYWLSSDNDGRDPHYTYVRFINADNHDYRLHSSSECIDKGDSQWSSAVTDLLGLLRIRGGAIDLGCYESESENDCAAPVDLQVAGVTAKSAALNWSRGGNENRWKITYQIEGEAARKTMEVSDTMVTLTGLSGYKQYVAFVQSVCSSSSLSECSFPVYFETPCDTNAIMWVSKFTTFTPVNNAVVYNSVIPIAWNAIPKVEYYDLYVWKEGETKPIEPTFSKLKSSFATYGTQQVMENGQIYHWQVVATQQCQTLVSDTISFKMYDLPDLHVTELTHTLAQATKKMTVSWKVKNDSPDNVPQGSSWSESIWLSPSLDVDKNNQNSLCLATVNNQKVLNAGEEYTQTVEVTIPERMMGDYYLFAMANMSDAYQISIPDSINIDPYTPNISGKPYSYLIAETHQIGTLKEANALDNFFFKKINILPPPSPDLLPAQITGPDTLMSDALMQVSWNIINQGEKPAQSSWYDAVYLSRDSNFIVQNAIYLGTLSNQQKVNAGDTLSRDISVPLPKGTQGKYYLYVMTDIEDNVYEGLGEDNNIARSLQSVSVQPIPAADLQILSVDMPSVIDEAGVCQIEYKVVNAGDITTGNATWWDAVYLSQDSVFDSRKAHKVFMANRSVSMAKNDTCRYKALFNVPDEVIEGQWFCFVVADDNNDVVEKREDNNCGRSSIATTLAKPDLTVRHLTAVPVPQSVNQYEISWFICNQGAGNVVDRILTDQLDIDGESLIVEEQMVSINAKDSLYRSVVVTLPCAENMKVKVITDVLNRIHELEETNNSDSVSMKLVYPDVTLSSLEAIDTVEAGDFIALHWSLINAGDAAMVETRLLNEIYVSETASFNMAKAVKMDSYYTEKLTVGAHESLAMVKYISCPSYWEGNYYFYVVTNADSALCEGSNHEKNHIVSLPVYVTRPDYADLTVSRCQVADTLTMGESAIFSYTVLNTENAQISLENRSWTDKIYLSQEMMFNKNSAIEVGEVSQCRTLSKGGSFEQSVPLSLPLSLEEGDYYLFVMTDASDDIFEGVFENNNIRQSQRIHIKSYPINLAVQSVNGKSKVRWSDVETYTVVIKNDSRVATMVNEWTDVVYLSSDERLDSTDICVATQLHHSVVNAGGQYEASFDITIPEGTPKQVYLLAVADIAHLNKESHYADNVYAEMIKVDSLATSDLRIDTIMPLTAVAAGQAVRICYQVTNTGKKDIIAEWNDLAYRVDSIDVLMANKHQNRTLLAGSSYVDTMTVFLPQDGEGIQNIRLIVNAYRHLYESLWTNNEDTVQIQVNAMVKGDLAVTHIESEAAVMTGADLHIQWNVQNVALSSLRCQGVTDRVYLSTDPILDSYDICLGSVTENIFLPVNAYAVHALSAQIGELEEGDYYLMVVADATMALADSNRENNLLVSATPLHISRPQVVDTAGFSLLDIAPNYGGNNGNVTVVLMGSHFDKDMKAVLSKDSSRIEAVSVERLSSVRALAQFDLQGADKGKYSVALYSQDSAALLMNAFEVRAAEPASLYTHLDIPNNLRPNQVVCMTLVFVNQGNVDMEMPIVVLESHAGAYIALSENDLKYRREVLEIPLYGEGNNTVLRPGERGVVNVYAYTSGNLVFTIRKDK